MNKSSKGEKGSPPTRRRHKARRSDGQQAHDRPKASVVQGSRSYGLSSKHYTWIFLGLILLFVVAVRTRLLGFSLERDEGEYAYLGQLIQQGIPPYAVAYNMKLPGTYFMYALIMSLFGQSISGIHLGLMLMNCATILLVYKVSAKIVSPFSGILAACSYGFLSLSPAVCGFAAHATHFVVLWAMAGLLVLLYALENKRFYLYFAAGVLLGLAFIMKQPGVFLVIFGAIYIGVYHWQNRTLGLKRMLSSLGMFSCGVLAVMAIMLAYLYLSGVFEKFWFFTFVYASKYVSQIPLSKAVYLFIERFSDVTDGFLLLWVFAGLGVIALILHPRLKGKRALVSLFTICSFLTVCPGFYFRGHYFITLLPAASLLVGIFIDYIYVRSIRAFKTDVPGPKQGVLKCVPVALFALAIVTGVVQQSEYLFEENLVSLSRRIYGDNPFPESVEIARFIARNTSETDTIAVMGSEPQIYFYSGRHSATGHIYTYGLMELHDYSLAMQKEMAHEIERGEPKVIVLVRVGTSWLAKRGSEKFILQWCENYVTENYDLVGIIDIISDNNTVYKWHEEVRGYAPRSTQNLLVFQRR